jgi:4-hydroxy-3-methylbut-2-enyl diphosphate reductase
MTAASICAPLAAEWLALRPTHAPLLHTGMGPRRSIAAAQRLRGQGVLVAGVAGGLAAHVRAGDVVVATEVQGPESQRVVCPSAPLLAGELRRLGLTVHMGPIRSTRRVLAGTAEREALAASGALAVDTESAWLAPAGGEPFAVVRSISDTVHEPLWRPGIVPRGARALGVLRKAVPALDAWVAALGPHEITLANPRSFCAGVQRAIDIVERAIERFGRPVYVRRQIVHNAHVVTDLERRGAVFVTEADEVPRGAVLVLAAHGVSPQVRAQAAERDLSVIDATCPLVTKVHAEVRRYAERGDTVFLIGHADHEEVEGTLGEAPDHVVVVEDLAAAAAVTPRDPARVAYATQTTLAVEEAERIADVLRDRFPKLSGPDQDDICYATSNRQTAVREAAQTADLLLVVGSANSSNSLRLVEVAQTSGVDARRVDDAGQVELGWLVGRRRIAVTAGASAPARLVDDVVAALSGLGPSVVSEAPAEPEDVHFTLPKEVR